MNFIPLASSSAGNAYIIEDGQTRILIECGITFKKLQQLAGFKTSTVHACLVSHEHKDHSKCVDKVIAAGIPVYMSEGTADALELETVQTMAHNECITVGTIDVVAFNTYHDAREPLGFLLSSREDGDVVVFAADTVNLAYRFPGVNILAIEANYDKYILERCERLPDKVRYRITNSHMEIDTLCKYLRSLDLSSLREVHLLHLSDATSHEGHFINKVTRAVPPGVRVTACPK